MHPTCLIWQASLQSNSCPRKRRKGLHTMYLQSQQPNLIAGSTEYPANEFNCSLNKRHLVWLPAPPTKESLSGNKVRGNTLQTGAIAVTIEEGEVSDCWHHPPTSPWQPTRLKANEVQPQLGHTQLTQDIPWSAWFSWHTGAHTVIQKEMCLP